MEPLSKKTRRLRGETVSRSALSINNLIKFRSMKSKSTDQESKGVFDTVKHSIKRKIHRGTITWRLYDWTLLCLSLISCVLFIHETYRKDPAQMYFLDNFEKAMAGLFTFDWCLNFFLADVKVAFVMSFFSMVDIFTVIPIWVTSSTIVHQPVWGEITTIQEGVLFFIFGLETTRILRALRLRRFLTLIEDVVDRCIAEIFVTGSIMLLFNAAVIQYLEASEQPWQFHTWMYFIWVTISTVGYGDITARSILGRFAVMLMISFAIISVPRMTNKLLELMSKQSVYARASYHPQPRVQHVLICGNLKTTSLVNFFGELFHKNHVGEKWDMHLHAVVLQSDPPSPEMEAIMCNPTFHLSITYLEGSVMNPKDLDRACADSACAIMMLTDKLSPIPDEEDAMIILQQLSILRHANASRRDTMTQRFCLQLIRTENLRHLGTQPMTIFNKASKKIVNKLQVVCLNEIKMNLLAKSVLLPGFNALMMNLICSYDDNVKDEYDARLEEKNANISSEELFEDGDPEVSSDMFKRFQSLSFRTDKTSESNSSDAPLDWATEYQQGCEWEIYTSRLSAIFSGAPFNELAYLLYQRIGIVLLGLHLTNLEQGVAKEVLNPGNFRIPKTSNKLNVLAYVVARSKEDADLFHLENKGLISSVKKFFEHRNKTGKVFGHADPSRPSFSMRALEEFAAASLAGMQKEGKGASRWTLLKKAIKDTVDTTVEEDMQRKKQENMIRLFHVRSFTPDMDTCVIKTSVIDEVQHINGHIILMTKSLENICDLVLPLRARSTGVLKYIVILHSVEVTSQLWRKLGTFEGILLVKGSPSEETDIIRCGIYRAHQVVVVSDTTRESKHVKSTSKSLHDDENCMVDAEAVFVYQAVRRLNPHAQVVVEMIHEKNVLFLDASSAIHEYKFTPQFASGTLFSPSMTDNLVCQAFYNPEILAAIVNLIRDHGTFDPEKNMRQLQDLVDKEAESSDEGINAIEEEEEEEENDIETGPRVPVPKSASAKASRSVLASDDIDFDSIPASTIYLIDIPDAEIDTYGGLFKVLAQDRIIPLGLLRGVVKGLTVGHHSNKEPYVFTNPDEDTKLHHNCDKVFVLSLIPLNSTKMTIKGVLTNIQTRLDVENENEAAKQAHTLKTSKGLSISVSAKVITDKASIPTSTPTAAATSPQGNDYSRLVESHKELEEKLHVAMCQLRESVNSLTSDVASRLRFERERAETVSLALDMKLDSIVTALTALQPRAESDLLLRRLVTGDINGQCMASPILGQPSSLHYGLGAQVLEGDSDNDDNENACTNEERAAHLHLEDQEQIHEERGGGQGFRLGLGQRCTNDEDVLLVECRPRRSRGDKHRDRTASSAHGPKAVKIEVKRPPFSSTAPATMLSFLGEAGMRGDRRSKKSDAGVLVEAKSNTAKPGMVASPGGGPYAHLLALVSTSKGSAQIVPDAIESTLSPDTSKLSNDSGVNERNGVKREMGPAMGSSDAGKILSMKI